jgi:hypothetical protein
MQGMCANVSEEPVQSNIQAGSLGPCDLEDPGGHSKAGISSDDFGARHPLCELAPASTGKRSSCREVARVCRIYLAHFFTRYVRQSYRCTKMGVEVAVRCEDVELIR